MAKAKISKTSDRQTKPTPQKDRPHRPCFTPEEWEKTVPISQEKFRRLREAWFAISDLGDLLKETSSDGPTNPCYVLRILTDELGQVVIGLESQFEKQAG